MKSKIQMHAYRPLLSLVLIFALAGCDGLLSVNDPGAIQVDDLDNPAMEDLIMHGVLSEFQYAHGYMLLTASILSDELYTDHTNIDHREFALFNFSNTNALNNNTYTFLQKARVIAEDAVDRLTGFHGTSTGVLNIAIAHAYAGYSYVLLGEHFCQAPINVGPALTSNQLLEAGIDHFERAMQAASGTSGAGAGGITPDVVRNLANLGAARASLQMGRMDDAINYAQNVSPGFSEYIYRSSNSGREQNIIGVQWQTTGQWLSIDPRFQNLEDPRIRHTADDRLGLNARPIYVPYRPMMYAGWDAGNTQQIVETSTHVRFASHLEAQYIIAEASGPTPETLQFVNERRAVGGDDSISVSGDALMAELREQRARDFFMAVQRHGDMRRYLNLYDIDLFPTGSYPVTTEQYGEARCFIIPLSEIGANPNL
jgi:starch-binding outer membrane protein, SusD/RagB family